MKRVLVVDDKEENLYYLNALMMGHGYSVETARHGAEALVRARESPPALIIADLLMPVMDGYTLLRHWKSDERLKNIPFIVYTATYTAPEDEKLALDLGADAFLVKPMEPEEFIIRVREVEEVSGKASPNLPVLPVEEHEVFIEQYSAALVRKLEEKTFQLEDANRALEREVSERRQLAAIQSTILDALPAHVALLDSKGVIVAVNEPWRLSGVGTGIQGLNSVIGSNYLDICDSVLGQYVEDVRAVSAGIHDVLAGNTPGYSLEYPCHTPEQKVWYRVIVTPLRDNPTGGAVVTHMNITEVKIAEEQSRKDTERLALALDAASIGIWEWNPVTGELIWDERMCELYDLPTGSSLTYDAWLSMVHPDDGPDQHLELQKTAKQDNVGYREFRILSKAGVERFIYAAEKSFTSPDGSVGNVIGINLDVSERKRAEAEVNEIKTRLETLVAEAKVGILVHTEFSPIIANAELVRIFGYDREDEILHMPTIRVLFPDEVQEDISRYYEARMKGEGIKDVISITGRKKDGSLVELESRSFPIQWGDRLSVCAMITDVTEQRKLEARLRQSQRLEAVGQMTGGIAHDFNNLLTVILGNAEALQSRLAHDDKLRELAELTMMAAERGAELTNRLLAFSRRQPLDPKAIDINKLVTGMDGLLRRALGEHIEIRTICAGGLGDALVDAPQFESAILNLAVNARDAMPDGGTLTIETKNVHLDDAYVADQSLDNPGQGDLVPGDYVLVAVSDAGTGMDEKTRLQAFDPFFTTKDVGKGSGLGLSMVYGFMRQSMGHVRIYSEIGQGTTIKLYLPVAGSDASRPEKSAPQMQAPLGSEKILVVEDDELVRNQVAAQLKSLGYQVVVAPDGIEALRLLAEMDDFSLLFTDVVMPRGMSGRQLAERASELWPNLPVLFTSGYAENALFHHGRLDEGVHLLNKPYRRLDLATKIRSILDRQTVTTRASVHS